MYHYDGKYKHEGKFTNPKGTTEKDWTYKK